jgi:small GTP-binding protein
MSTKSTQKMQIIVLGDGAVGKSAITVQYVQGVFISLYDPTIEDSFRKIVEVDGKQYFAEITDTAGTEQFIAMRDLYLKEGEGFVLVFSVDSRCSFEKIKEIRDQIIRVKDCNSFPFVIVGNKCDLPNRTVSKDEASKLAVEWGVSYYDVSAKTCTNIHESFTDLMRKIIYSKPTTTKQKKNKNCSIL